MDVWQLQEAGLIELTVAQPQATREKRQDWLGLDVAARRTVTYANPSGILAEELFALCGEEPTLVSSVIVAWGKSKGVNPKRIIFLPLDAIVTLTHLDTCIWLGADPLPPGRSKLDCEAVVRQRASFEQLRTRWGRFVDHDTDLAAALLRCCDAGLSRLRPPKYAAVVS